MSSPQNALSGHRAFGNGFTMITGVGGAPVDRTTADRMCRDRDGEQPDDQHLATRAS